ncbi:MAG: hypothetical protein ACTHJ6_09570 [Oryzihumus sp.]
MDQVSTPLSPRVRHGLHPELRDIAAQAGPGGAKLGGVVARASSAG